MKAPFLIAASLIIGTAAIAQDSTPPAAPPASTDMTTAAPAPAPASDPAAMSAPAPMTNASPSTDTAAPATTDTSSYPPCSRTVHDKCVQSHEMARKAKPRH
jgi:hypothetical protein